MVSVTSPQVHLYHLTSWHYINFYLSYLEQVNKKLLTRNMMLQLLTLYTDSESHNAQHYRQTDGQTGSDTNGQH